MPDRSRFFSTDRRIAVVCLLLVLGFGSRIWLSAASTLPARQDFSQFPRSVGTWSWAGDIPLTDDVTSVLKADDYLMRDFRAPDGRIASLFIAYYKTQQAGESMHSPKNCLPGAGWAPIVNDRISMGKDASGNDLMVNRYVIEKDRDRALALYWYQEGGRVIASEYKGKGYLVWDAMRTGRRDGAIVRVLLPVGANTSVDDATKTALSLARAARPVLPAFLPN